MEDIANSPCFSEKTEDAFTVTWTPKNCWIGAFDILGFKNLIFQAENDIHRDILTEKFDELIKVIDNGSAQNGCIDYLIFSDTFVVLAQDLAPNSYPWFLRTTFW